MNRRPLFAAVWLARFRADRRGVSALEFALILPIMLLLYFGIYEVTHGVTITRKVTNVTSALGDLVAQSRILTEDDIDNILDAAAAIIAPYPTSKLNVVVSGVTIDGNGRATIDWTRSRRGLAESGEMSPPARAEGDQITLPADLDRPNTYLVMSEATYFYTPTFGYVMTGTFALGDVFYLRPRQRDKVTFQ